MENNSFDSNNVVMRLPPIWCGLPVGGTRGPISMNGSACSFMVAAADLACHGIMAAGGGSSPLPYLLL